MVKSQFLLADIPFSVQAADAFTAAKDSIFKPFIDEISSGVTGIDVRCEIDTEMNRDLPQDIGLSDVAYQKQAENFCIYMRDAKGAIAHIISAGEGFRQVSIRSSFAQSMPFLGSAGEVLFRTAILFYNGISVHSAAIDCNGSGLIFSAPSGTGKSTQANLWRRHAGAVVLNGDRPALRTVDDTVYVYGTPWSGSSPDSRNAKAPLKAIIMLQQADKNVIRELTKPEAVEYLLPRCFLPFGVESLLEKAIANTETIINKTPVFHLKCRPDAEAVTITRACLNL